MDSKKGSKKEPKPQPAVIRHYLLAYNLAQLVGWAYIGVLIVRYVATSVRTLDDLRGLYPVVLRPLQFFQLLMGLEILHALLGFVHSPWFSVVMQLWGRFHALFGALWVVSRLELDQVLSVPMMIICWTLAECIRYSFYISNMVHGKVPKPLLWLRYSAFLPVYPPGTTGEFLTILFGLKYFKQDGIRWWYWTSIVVLCAYPFGFGQLYMYMLSQRKKNLGGKRKAKKSQ